MRRTSSVLLLCLSVVLGLAAPVRAVPPPGYRSTISLVTASQLGSSWRAGCPVGPDDLRRVTLTHRGFDGAVRTGSLVVHEDVAGQVVDALADLFRLDFPIERIVPVDAYGGSDDASMAANNTSAFNCRPVAGGTSWSWHAYGRAIDLNPVQNPYVRGSTVLPPAGAAHLDRSPGKGRLRPGEGTIEAFTGRGWTWGGTWTSPRDYQHMERRSGPAGTVPAHGGAAVAAPGAGVLHVAQRTGTGAVALRTRTGGRWSAPTDLGGYSASTPDLAARGTQLDVVILGGDGAAWHRRWAGSSWSAWRSLGGAFASGPTVVASGPDRLDVFGRGLDGALWTSTRTGSGWSPWRSLGGGLASDPDATSWSDGRIDVVAQGTDGAIWQRALAGGRWSPWHSLGGIAGSGPGIASRAPGRLDVMMRSPNGQVYGRAWTGRAWTPWSSVGGLVASDPDLAAEPGAGFGTLHVAAADAVGTGLYGRAHGTSWGTWTRWPAG